MKIGLWSYRDNKDDVHFAVIIADTIADAFHVLGKERCESNLRLECPLGISKSKTASLIMDK